MSLPLKVIFMGTPEFAARALQALIDGPHEVIAVYSQPPKPQGRGQKITKSPVHQLADAHSIPVYTPKSLKTAEAQAEFKALQADIAVVAAYGLILPQAILDAPRLGCINIHASLLPRWRGAAPIQRAILAGDNETGITFMQMDAGLDTGAMLKKVMVPITDQTTTPQLHNELAAVGAAHINQLLTDIAANNIAPETQPKTGISYAVKLTKDEGRLDWQQPAAVLDRIVHALTPWPGTYFEYNNERIKVLAAEVIDMSGTPGTLIDNQATIACSKQALRLLRVQRPNKSPVSGEEFLRGNPISHVR